MKRATTRRGIALALGLSGLSGLSACGGGGSEAKDPQGVDPNPKKKGGGGVAVSAEIGAIDGKQFEAKWDSARRGALACITQRSSDLPYLSGSVKVAMRIKSDGSLRYAYMKHSTLGDRKAEDCILALVNGMSWPKPIGGEEGLADGELEVDAAEGDRAPIPWSADKVQKKLPNLASCGLQGGATLTLYVGTDGVPISVGVAGNSEKVEEAASCIVRAVQGTKFASPGSWLAKVTVTVD